MTLSRNPHSSHLKRMIAIRPHMENETFSMFRTRVGSQIEQCRTRAGAHRSSMYGCPPCWFGRTESHLSKLGCSELTTLGDFG
jgi:hypothetical protein